MLTTFTISPDPSLLSEGDVQAAAARILTAQGFVVKHHKSGNSKLDAAWPSKTATASGVGKPDTLVFVDNSQLPAAVWENKQPTISVNDALKEAQFYVEGLHKNLPKEPGLPRVAAGYNGIAFAISYFTPDGQWVQIKSIGKVLANEFPNPELLKNGIGRDGNFTGYKGYASVQDLRSLLSSLKTAYRVIPILSAGRNPVDFTIALLTLRLLVEQNTDWGSWSEQPSLVSGNIDFDKAIAERLVVLTDRIISDEEKQEKYGDIFHYKEAEQDNEINFDFKSVLSKIPRGKRSFEAIYNALDKLPPIEHSTFDIFGEVFQWIGDESTKKSLGEFFTGRHIISGVLPIVLERSGKVTDVEEVEKLKIADIACGTGGFLTETLRYVKRKLDVPDDVIRDLAKQIFFGYDIGHANASRARVNMYFAGDGFSKIEGGFDSLSPSTAKNFPKKGFDFVLTNPPYGKSTYGRAEEAFLKKTISVIKSGGWGLIVLPSGILENPRSAAVRYHLISNCKITDIISLPKHAFAPYTLQKTAVVIFQKRGRPVLDATGEWSELDKVKDEKIALYVVDNDGYANSDKRYPTDKRDSSNMPLHNELTEWIDSSGEKKPSHLFKALIDDVKPRFSEDEFGNPTGEKYKRVTVGSMLDPNRGINLSPESVLRPIGGTISYVDFRKQALEAIAFYDGLTATLPSSLAKYILDLLGRRVSYDDTEILINSKTEDIFTIVKGNSSLNEMVIYENHDPAGIQVYGGGAEVPKFRISRKTIKGDGKPIKVFRAPAISMSVDGSSGSMQVLTSGEFTANHHAAILTPYDEEFEIYWFKQQYQNIMKYAASNKEGSATLTLPTVRDMAIVVPTKATRAEIDKLHRRLQEILDEIS